MLFFLDSGLRRNDEIGINQRFLGSLSDFRQ